MTRQFIRETELALAMAILEDELANAISLVCSDGVPEYIDAYDGPTERIPAQTMRQLIYGERP